LSHSVARRLYITACRIYARICLTVGVLSIKVREWLRRLNIGTTHEEREEIDREIEQRTGRYCDSGIELLSEAEFLAIVESVKRKRKRAVAEPLVA
jgi:hypothetical protein